jgi:hypothetical protein
VSDLFVSGVAIPYLWEFDASSSGPDPWGGSRFTGSWMDSAGMASVLVAGVVNNPGVTVGIEEAIAPAGATGGFNPVHVRVSEVPAVTDPYNGGWSSYAFFGEVALVARYFRLVLFNDSGDVSETAFDFEAAIRGVAR